VAEKAARVSFLTLRGQDVVELTVKLNERVINIGGRSGTAAPLIGWRQPSRTAMACAAASEATPRA
jgi:hypothetical protein